MKHYRFLVNPYFSLPKRKLLISFTFLRGGEL
jgi:hypothetical protein